jgi:hypothetical protein
LTQHKQFRKMNLIVDNMESLLFEAHKTKGWQWVSEEPLWVTWPMEKFGAVLPFEQLTTSFDWLIYVVSSISEILTPYHRSLDTHIHLVSTLRLHSSPFETSQIAISEWVAQRDLQENGWTARWEDLCAAEIEGWDRSS